MQDLTRDDFTGGFTDDLFDQDPKKCFANDNLLLDNDDRPVTRWGSLVLSQPSGAATRISRFMLVDHAGPTAPSSYAYAIIGRSIYYGAVSDSTGKVSSLSLLKADYVTQSFVTTATNVPWSHWDGVLYHAGGSNKLPCKYIPGISSTGPVTAGMPDVPDTANTDVYANDAAKISAAATLGAAIKSAMGTHFTDTGQHVSSDATSNALLPSGTPATLAALITYVNSLIAAYQSHFIDQRTISQYHRKETTSSTIPQVTLAQQTLVSTVAPTTLIECVDRLHDLKESYNAHFANQDIHANTTGGSAAVTSAFLTGVDSGPRISPNYQALYDFANRLKAKYEVHRASTTVNGAHSTAADATNTITASDATTLETLGTLIFNLRGSYNQHDVDAEKAAAWSYHIAQEASNHSLTRRAPTTTPPNGDTNYGLYAGPKTLPDIVSILNELKTAYNGHVEDWTTHYTNKPATQEANTLSGPNISLGQYVYAFAWKRSWNHNAYKTSVDIGPVLLKTATNVVAVEYAPITLTKLPTFANATSITDWITDTTLTLQIYRTSSGGTDFFRVGEVANGTTTFTDNVTDETLVTNEALYTNSGEAENSHPPVCSALHISNGRGYYGNTAVLNVTTGSISEYNPNRVYQSKTNDPDSVPEDFYEDLASPVVGISSVRTVTVVLCKRQIVRLDGVIDDLGRGGMNPVVIADKLGCVSESSIVQIEGGILFAGTDGFYWTDGYQVQILSDDWRGTYQTLIDSTTKCERISAAYDQDNKLVFFGVQRQSASSDNDSWLCLHLDYGIKKDACWTTASNGTIFGTTALLSTAQGKLLRGDRQGYVFYHQESYLTDSYVNTAIATTLWGTAPIVPDYQTCQIDFGSRALQKWVPKMVSEHKQLTALNLAINVNNDDGKTVAALTPIDRNLGSYTAPTDIAFGTASNPQSTTGKFIEKRHFPATTLRCTTKALQFTGSIITLRDSVTDADGTAVISGSTATLSNGTKSWPTDCVGQYFTLATDSYVTRYRIIQRNSATVITLASAPAASTVDWRIKGYPKDQRWKMLSFVLKYSAHDESQDSPGDGT